MRILIAEDDESNLLVLQRSLEHEGYKVLTAKNGKEALKLAQSNKLDLIISDIMMPEMDGYEFCRCLKADEKLKTIPFIFYTATYVENEHEAMGKSLGAEHFIIKPIETDEMLQLVADTLQQSEKTGAIVEEIDVDKSIQQHESILTNKLTEKVKQLEEEQVKLAKLNYELELRVEERTAELAAAKEKAERANRTKTVFLETMSHELRTPLSNVIGFSQLLLKQSDHSKQTRRYLHSSLHSSEHLLRLINNILNISEVEAGGTNINNGQFSINLLINNIVEMFQYQLDESILELSLYLDKNVPAYLETDESKLRQILINIIGNAIKFTQEGQIYIRVKLLDDKQTLIIEVEDTGPGIAETDQESIFHAFHKSTQDDYDIGGTGLGLTVSRHYARLLGGDILVDSDGHLGSTFKLKLPIEIPENISKFDRFSQINVDGMVPKGKPPCILVVDDIEMNLFILVKQLEIVGFDVVGVESGSEALIQLKSWPADLVLLDYIMPDMNGIETLKHIRKLNNHKETPVIMYSASTMANDQQKCLMAGADGFLSKPVNQNELFALIARLLKIEYQYEENDEYIELQKLDTLETADLSNIDLNWLKEFIQIVRLGDADEMINKLNSLDEKHSDVKNKLGIYVQEFQLQPLIKVLERSIDQSG